MQKEEILNELKKTANKYPPSYNSLCTVAKVIAIGNLHLTLRKNNAPIFLDDLKEYFNLK